MFLFSGGFLLSGYMFPPNQYEKIWANGNISFRRILDYQPGIIGMNPEDEKANIYSSSK